LGEEVKAYWLSRRYVRDIIKDLGVRGDRQIDEVMELVEKECSYDLPLPEFTKCVYRVVQKWKEQRKL